MKKVYGVLIFLVALFMGIGVVSADTGLNPNCVTAIDGKTKTCRPTLTDVEQGDLNGLVLIVQMQSAASINSVAFNNGWRQISSGTATPDSGFAKATQYNIIYKKNTIPAGNYELGTFVFNVNVYGENCSVRFVPAPYCTVRRVCSISNGIYYDINGDIVTQAEYKASCGCREARGTYFNNNGEEISELEYMKVCLKPTCVQLSDGTFMGSEGTVVTQDVYAQQCGLKCGKINNTYYDKNGTAVANEEAMVRSCYPGTCKVSTLSDNTNIYFGKDGTAVTKEVYEDTCFEKPKCKKDGDKYYDKDGNETNEETYAKQCTKVMCRVMSDGTIYGKDGKVVDKITYEKQCTAHTCDVLSDGTYYDKDGKETTKENWELVCKEHKCEIKGDKYFNDKGMMVTKEEYDKACTNPPTGSVTDKQSISYIISGLLFAGTIIFISIKYSKLKRI